MKNKILPLLLSILMVFTLAGCNSSNDQSTIVDEPEKQEEVVEPKEDDPIVGGFVDVEDRTITDELKEIFNKAKEGYVGISLEPVELYQTQVVAGTNYKFVCSGTKTTNPPIKGTYFVTVYKDLQGNCSIIDVETVTESSGDVDGDTTVKEVDKSMNYWVVFYNPDGLELDRQAIKYGTTPTYKGEDPIYWDDDYWYRFICWTDKQGNEIKEFTPITGNTYIYAKYEIGGKAKQEAASAPMPSGLVTVTFIITDGNGHDGYVLREHNIGSYMISGTQLQFPIGASYSTSGNEITIDGVIYDTYCPSAGAFGNWLLNGTPITSGQLIENSTLSATFGPP